MSSLHCCCCCCQSPTNDECVVVPAQRHFQVCGILCCHQVAEAVAQSHRAAALHACHCDNLSQIKCKAKGVSWQKQVSKRGIARGVGCNPSGGICHATLQCCTLSKRVRDTPPKQLPIESAAALLPSVRSSCPMLHNCS